MQVSTGYWSWHILPCPPLQEANEEIWCRGVAMLDLFHPCVAAMLHAPNISPTHLLKILTTKPRLILDHRCGSPALEVPLSAGIVKNGTWNIVSFESLLKGDFSAKVPLKRSTRIWYSTSITWKTFNQNHGQGGRRQHLRSPNMCY